MFTFIDFNVNDSYSHDSFRGLLPVTVYKGQ